MEAFPFYDSQHEHCAKCLALDCRRLGMQDSSVKTPDRVSSKDIIGDKLIESFGSPHARMLARLEHL
jgi:hypothetical protein